jgi:hypothetical protein
MVTQGMQIHKDFRQFFLRGPLRDHDHLQNCSLLWLGRSLLDLLVLVTTERPFLDHSRREDDDDEDEKKNI